MCLCFDSGPYLAKFCKGLVIWLPAMSSGMGTSTGPSMPVGSITIASRKDETLQENYDQMSIPMAL